MTFNAYETSIDAGMPLLLFDFFVGTAHWRYTTADRNITFSAATFAPAPISAGSINQGNEIKRKTLDIIVDAGLTVVGRLRNFPPSSDLMVTITALHETDPDQEGYVVFIGRVVSQSQAGVKVRIRCEPAYTGVKAVGLRRRWQIGCPHVLYGVGTCTLSPAAWRVVSAISAISGTAVTCAGIAPPTGLSFAGGYIEWDSGSGYNERRSIDSAAGTVLTIAYGSPDLIVGLALNVYPGCKHNAADCTSFGNILNYGGELYIPSVNPLAGNPIY
jgi:Phage conserved hypothetical protein BR0599